MACLCSTAYQPVSEESARTFSLSGGPGARVTLAHTESHWAIASTGAAITVAAVAAVVVRLRVV